MNKKALITGASYGIGKAFAQELARQNYDLALVARSADKLQEVAQQLQTDYQIQTFVMAQDLTEPNAGQLIYDTLHNQNWTIDLLINNAGFGDYGKFIDRSLTKQLNMIQLNVTVLTELTGLFLPGMIERRQGGIINVSSIAGYQPLPYMSVYSATKAFVLNFTEALWAEYKDSGVHLLALCPGPTESEFPIRAEFPMNFGKDKKQNIASAQEVVKEALKALEKNQCSLVTGGLGNQFIVNVSRFVPRDLLVTAIEKQFKFS